MFNKKVSDQQYNVISSPSNQDAGELKSQTTNNNDQSVGSSMPNKNNGMQSQSNNNFNSKETDATDITGG